MQAAFDRGKSLQELEGCDWGEPDYHSHLVTTVHRLRRQPLKDFSAGDLRICIGQNVGLPFLVPLAVERLEREPLAEGYFYPGDLLNAVLRVEGSFWTGHPDLLRRVREVLVRATRLLPPPGVDGPCEVRKALAGAAEVFVGRTQHLP